MRRWMMATALCLAVVGLRLAQAAEPHGQPATLPEGPGLAAKYRGDEGIEKDGRVLYVEDFETGDIADIGARWDQADKAQNMDLSTDIPANSPGRKSLHIAKNGHLFTHTRGVDTMYARFYVKFHPKTGYIHHFVEMLADRVPTAWPKGLAGLKPAGDQGFETMIEPWGKWGAVPPPGVWHFYSYWQEMKPSSPGSSVYWGNFFDTEKSQPIEPGRWHCVEAMVKANSKPELADGEQAFWIDGKLVGRFGAFRWRSSDKLKLNTFWLKYYVTEAAAQQNKDTDPNRVYEVWFDDIVLATEYIGPVQGKPKAGKKVATPSKSALKTPGLLVVQAGV